MLVPLSWLKDYVELPKNPADLVERHLEWFRSDPPDVGTLVGRVLRRVEAGEDAATAAHAIWSERGPEVSAGNGSVMYCAPLGLAYANRPGELPRHASALSALTHFDGRCRTAVLAVTLGVAGCGEDRGHPRVAGQSQDESMFTGTGADNEYAHAGQTTGLPGATVSAGRTVGSARRKSSADGLSVGGCPSAQRIPRRLSSPTWLPYSA